MRAGPVAASPAPPKAPPQLPAGGDWPAGVAPTEEFRAAHHHLREGNGHLFVTGRAGTGKSARVLRNRWTEAWEQPGAPKPLGMPLQQLLVAKFRQAVADWDRPEWEIIAAGQGAGRIHELKPARQVVFDLMEEARDVLDEMTGEPE